MEVKVQRKVKSMLFEPCPFNLAPALKSLLGEHSESEPPDPIPNSEVKPLSADDSVAGCHAKVGNCQAFNMKTRSQLWFRVFFCLQGSR